MTHLTIVHQYTAKMEHILEQFILDWHRLRVFVQLRDRSGQNVNETQYINGGPSRKYNSPHMGTICETLIESNSLISFDFSLVFRVVSKMYHGVIFLERNCISKLTIVV